MSKKKMIIIGVVAGLFVLMLGIRFYNLKVRHTRDNETTEPVLESGLSDFTYEEQVTTQPVTTESYHNSLGLDADRDKDERISIKETTTPPPTTEPQKDPTYPVSVNIFAHTSVPDKNMDDSSCKAYLASVSLDNFGSGWGSKLTHEDFLGGKLYTVGVEQDNVEKLVSDLQSVGWLISNLNRLNNNDAVKFTNLHVIGSLSNSHIALLCSYDWYSAFGLDDTLVVFEDISNTLSVSDFREGDVFSATVFVHNMKVVKVNNKNVVVVEYSVY